jgi:hypothetical protein
VLQLLTAGFVQVFGRRQRRSDRTLCWPASEKRQGTKEPSSKWLPMSVDWGVAD